VKKIQPVILAGGTGSRLWPLSRELYPKQLLQLTDNTSLLQTTLLRISRLSGIIPPVVVVGEEHRFITRRQIEELHLFDDFTILLEPMGRNTAPAICGAVHFCKEVEDVVFLVLPADHVIMNQQSFNEAVGRAVFLAEKGSIVTFGIKPTSPETGYGYIEAAENYRVKSFKEKPDAELARKYLEDGSFFWNSGMFAFSGTTFADEIERYGAEMYGCMAEAVEKGEVDDRFFRLEKSAMQRCPADSIDYALLEKSDNITMVAAENLGWSDIGSWQALWDILDKDDSGNVTRGNVILESTENCLVRAEGMLIATVGLKDTLVVETSDALLVAPLSRSQDVKKIVTRLKKDKLKEFSHHRTVYRPWGSYTVLEESPRFQIKRITVSPGAKLSLQMHHHRYEHWVVVAGTARVLNGDREILLHENESTYIPVGTRHRLENPGVIDLELIEVQIGSYLGEDDIVRLEDVYGRQE
jgi:mannose-1-phosphate guanylyltransferase/mannose-6-phosphate isomerase